jgi:hypothetical protein
MAEPLNIIKAMLPPLVAVLIPHKMVTARDNLSQSTTHLEQESTPLELVGKRLEWTTRQVTAKLLPTVVLTLLLTSICHACQSVVLHHKECSPAT